MKKIIGFPITWILYYIGDMISYPMNWFDSGGHLYPAYNWCMLKSSALQDWAGLNSLWTKEE